MFLPLVIAIPSAALFSAGVIVSLVDGNGPLNTARGTRQKTSKTVNVVRDMFSDVCVYWVISLI